MSQVYSPEKTYLLPSTPRDWDEDLGNDSNSLEWKDCEKCGLVFFGYYMRTICKVCQKDLDK